MGRLSKTGTGPNGEITIKDLEDAGVVNKVTQGVKILSSDHVEGVHGWNPSRTPPLPGMPGYDDSLPDGGVVPQEPFPHSGLHLLVSRASQSAIAKLESTGNLITSTYYNRLSLRTHLKPHKFTPGMIPRDARPTKAKDLDFYTRWENRGYMCPEVIFRNLERKIELENEEETK